MSFAGLKQLSNFHRVSTVIRPIGPLAKQLAINLENIVYPLMNVSLSFSLLSQNSMMFHVSNFIDFVVWFGRTETLRLPSSFALIW